ncbi:MAG: inositol monophosphatase [Desulfobacterota bacterium]|nr:inositol monophosphatase [Thermodesulfobacteriota bacterium]
MVDTDIITAGIQALKQGGAVLRQHFGTIGAIEHKGKLDLVTDVDRRSEEAVVTFLSREFPSCGILTEEQPEIKSGSKCRWILDPLDGTTNYAHGYPVFCVSLAFEQETSLLWAGVYDPMRDELFTATRGHGATMNNQPLRVSTIDRLDRALLCTGFPYDVHDSAENNLDYFAAFITTAQAVRRDGSAALDLCYVAAGRFDGFWEMKLKPWDIAAGCLIVTEAGGMVTDFTGMPLDITHGNVLASNGCVHNAMLQILTKKEIAWPSGQDRTIS